MRGAISNDKLEAGRLLTGHYASRPGDLHGAFVIMGPKGTELTIMSSGTGPMCESWEHVSVSTKKRTPNWDEMAWVKAVFWRGDECVMQLHPPESEYVSHHPFCLHMWRPLHATIPLPPSLLVGPEVTGPDHV